MKKFKKFTKILPICLLLCLLICSFSGCNEAQPEEDGIDVYYVSDSITKIEVHRYYFSTNDFDSRLNEVLTALSTFPEKLEYKAPLGFGFKLLNYDYSGKKLTLNFSKEYLELDSTTEILIRAALVRTLTSFDEISYVGITVEGEKLCDNTGEAIGYMNGDKFIDNDGNAINTYEKIKVKLYFANESGDRLIASYREKYYSTNTPVEKFVVDELIAGPSGQISGLYATVNPETKIISVTTRDGVCYVNLDSSFLNLLDGVTLDATVYSIVDSLTELNNVEKVQILINGEVPDSLGTSAFERKNDIITTLE